MVKQGQSFLDKVLQSTGSVDDALAMAILNGKSITEDLDIGEELECAIVSNKRVVAHFAMNSEPATNISIAHKQEIENVGIGTMIIENNFEVA